MNDPEVYWVEFMAGRAAEVPWYFEYFQAADRCNCKPWELVGGEQDQTKNLDFWREAAMVVAQAEADHTRYVQEHPKARKPPSAPGAI